MKPPGYELVRLRDGTMAVRAAAYDETMHPGLGPAVEAELLYVRQLKLRERLSEADGEFVVWDIGLGAGANALTLLRLTRDIPCPLRLVSFDDTSSPLEFALENREALGYLAGYETTARELLDQGQCTFEDGARRVAWAFRLGDFPGWLAGKPDCFAPHAIMFDAFSPAKNPGMWTLSVFRDLFRLLDPKRPCALTTYSRSTMLRTTLLLAGFLVGRGIGTGLKEETTMAANALRLLDEPLDRNWLERARRSDCAEPMHQPVYSRSRLSDETWEALKGCRQFAEV